MFEKERNSKEVFFSRLSREGRKFMLEKEYDYFSPNEPLDEEPEKEPDITWNMEVTFSAPAGAAGAAGAAAGAAFAAGAGAAATGAAGALAPVSSTVTS